jgi:hypothetical protein
VIFFGLAPVGALFIGNLVSLSPLSSAKVALPITAPALSVILSLISIILLRSFFEWLPEKIFMRNLTRKGVIDNPKKIVHDIFINPQRREISLITITTSEIDYEVERVEASEIFILKERYFSNLKKELIVAGAFIYQESFSHISAVWNLISLQPQHQRLLEEFLLKLSANDDFLQQNVIVSAASGVVVCAPQKEINQSSLLLAGNLLTRVNALKELTKCLDVKVLYSPSLQRGENQVVDLETSAAFLNLGLFRYSESEEVFRCYIPPALLMLEGTMQLKLRQAFSYFNANQLGPAINSFNEIKDLAFANFFYEKLTTQMTSAEGMEEPVWRVVPFAAKSL